VHDLAQLLKHSSCLLFIGVGNVLKRDDGVGVFISQGINERPGILTLTVEVSIENYIGKINSMEPGEIVILDCMELGSEPGTYRLLELQQVEDLTFNTHNISLGRLGDFFDYPTYVLGIQPQSVEFGDELSLPVRDTATQIIQFINQNPR
jgi:hydrogenase 3 maturation protease